MSASAAPFPDTPSGPPARAARPADGALRRSLRRFTLGSGPLKRRSDRIQVLGRILVALSLLLGPPLAVVAATSTTTHLHEVVRAESSDRERVSATLLVDAPPLPRATNGDYGSYTPVRVAVRAVWQLPDGTSREGDVLAAPRSHAGTAVPVWVDREGRLTRAPLDPARITPWATLVGVLTLLGLPLAVWTLYAGLCFGLDARRERRWERDWAAVEPDWRPRLL